MFSIRPMSIADYDLVIELMKQIPGITFRDADSRENTARYLDRNANLSFVATIGSALVGCIMSGHDGRRGYLQHLLVLPNFRRQGISSALVNQCLQGLEAVGIKKSHIDVLKTNETGASYWAHKDWQLRTDILRYSFVSSGGANV
jgi:ribosomal protein S18 acetylase RimI-like enzyme